MQRVRPLGRLPVKHADVVRAVVAAIASAHAAVVGLDVEAFRAVLNGIDRADRLARRILAMLAEDGQVASLHVGKLTFPVALYSDPLHGPVPNEVTLFVQRDIVLSLTSHHASLTPGAAVGVNHHAPLVSNFVADLLFVCQDQSPSDAPADPITPGESPWPPLRPRSGWAGPGPRISRAGYGARRSSKFSPGWLRRRARQ